MSVQIKFEQAETKMVTQAKFEELQVDVESVKNRVSKLESGSGTTLRRPQASTGRVPQKIAPNRGKEALSGARNAL